MLSGRKFCRWLYPPGRKGCAGFNTKDREGEQEHLGILTAGRIMTLQRGDQGGELWAEARRGRAGDITINH